MDLEGFLIKMLEPRQVLDVGRLHRGWPVHPGIYPSLQLFDQAMPTSLGRVRQVLAMPGLEETALGCAQADVVGGLHVEVNAGDVAADVRAGFGQTVFFGRLPCRSGRTRGVHR